MAWTTPRTWNIGEVVTKTMLDQQIRDNMNAIWVGTTAGDIDYYTSATAKSRVAIGANGGILKSTGSAPSWVAAGGAGSIFYNNGASTPSWLTVGAAGAILKSTGSAPSWLAAGGAGSLFYNNGASTPAWLSVGTNGQVLRSTGSAPAWVDNIRYFTIMLNAGVSLVAGDDAARIRIPPDLNGFKLNYVAASRKAGTGVLTIQVRNVTTGSDILTTKLTIDSGETDSLTAATPAVIETANDDVVTGHQIAIDVDVAGTGTTYAIVQLGYVKA